MNLIISISCSLKYLYKICNIKKTTNHFQSLFFYSEISYSSAYLSISTICSIFLGKDSALREERLMKESILAV